jgi:HEAT repeat protein
MSALTSLLARDQAVPVRKIEEALQRQVITGGDIGSVLLETEAISENALAAYHAALYGLLPATRDEVMRVSRDTIRLVPREVAEKHRLVPLAVDGRALVVAMSVPLDHDVESQLGFLLGYDLIIRIVCEVRISAALLHHYGVEPPPRHRRLIEALRHREAGPVPYVAPPEHGKLDTSQRGLVGKKSSVSAWLDEPDEPDPPPPPPSPRSSAPPIIEGRTTDPMGFSSALVEASLGDAPSDPTLTEPASSESASSHPTLHPTLTEPAPSEPTPSPPPFSDAAPVEPAPPAEPRAPEPAAEDAFVDVHVEAPLYGADGRATSPYGRPALAPPSSVRPAEDAPPRAERLSVAPIVGVGVRKSSLPPSARPEPAPPPASPVAAPRVPIVEPVPDSTPAPEPVRPVRDVPPSPRLRGPLTPAQAAKLLDEADGRDAILRVFFAFARQFFDYTALFAVVEGRAEGRDAFGEGAPSSRVRGLSLSLAEPSLLASAKVALQPRLARLETVADADLAAVLERPRGAFALVQPVVLRGRAVLLLYADRGGDEFGLADVPELSAFVLRVVDALERLILRRKREGGGFTRSGGESRETLKAAATSLRASVRPPQRITGSQDRWAVPEADARPRPPSSPDARGERSLADAIAAAAMPATSAERAAARLATPPTGSADVTSPRSAPPGPHEAPAVVTASPPPSLAPALASPEVPVGTTLALAPAEDAYRATEELDREALAPPLQETGRRAPRHASTIRDMLGIPRAAPPPPKVDVDALLAGGGDPANEFSTGSTDMLQRGAPAGAASQAGEEAGAEHAEGPRTIPAPPPAVDDEPELVVGAAADDDPELSIGEADDDEGVDEEEAELREETTKPGVLRPRARGANTSYLVRGASVEVFERAPARSQPPGRRRSSHPPPASPASQPPAGDRTTRPLRRHDPRREDDGPTTNDVVPSRRSQPRDATPRLTSPTHDREVPSVIVDMGDSINALVENLLHADPQGEIPAIDALLKVGEVALPALAQSFPGPLWFDRRRPHRRLPRGRDVSPVARALVAFRDRAAPYVGALAGAASAERRFYALMVAAEIPAGPLVDPVVQRVFDEDAGVRSLALEVLPKLRAFPEMTDQLVFLRRTGRIRGKDPARRLHALAALAALRDAAALRMLVDLLEDEDAPVRHAAHEALVVLTCEDLGESMRRWAAWADRNEGRHRIEWLMDALLSSDERLRTLAGEELKTLTQQYFGFHPALSRKEREVIQAKYRQWWEHEGKAAFP